MTAVSIGPLPPDGLKLVVQVRAGRSHLQAGRLEGGYQEVMAAAAPAALRGYWQIAAVLGIVLLRDGWCTATQRRAAIFVAESEARGALGTGRAALVIGWHGGMVLLKAWLLDGQAWVSVLDPYVRRRALTLATWLAQLATAGDGAPAMLPDPAVPALAPALPPTDPPRAPAVFASDLFHFAKLEGR